MEKKTLRHLFNRGKKLKENKTNTPANKKDDKPSQSPSIVNDTQQRQAKKEEKEDEEKKFRNSENHITVICPEKKERVFGTQNILTFLAVLISAISLYLAFQSNIEVAKQFETANMPFLQLKEFKIHFIDDGRRVRFEPNLTNYGNHPIKTIKHRIAVLYDTIETNNYKQVNFTKPKNYEFVEVYCMKEKPEPFPLHTESHLPEIVYESAWKGLYNIYVWGEIVYDNLVTSKQRSYEFVVRLKKYPEKVVEEAILYNKNQD